MYLKTQIENLLRLAQEQAQKEPYYEVLKNVHLTGKQYFNIGIQTSDNLTFECGFKLTTTSTVISNGIFGGRHNTGRTQGNSTVWTGYEVRRVGSSTYTQIINRTRVGQVTTSQNIAIGTFYDMVFLPTSLQLNNTNITLTQGASIEQPMDIYLGAINSDGTANVPMVGDLTYFKIFDNGVLVSDCVPALNDKLEVCMYDKVRKILIKYSNISGETEAPTFERWNKFDVDYIENTGTSYIPFADITPTTTMGMNIEYAYTVLSSSEPAGVIGTYNGDTQRKDTFFVSTSSGYTQKASSPSSASCGVMVFHRGGNVGTSSSTSATYIEPEKDVWYKATVNWLGDGEITWTDGTNELSANVGANAVVTNQLRLFSRCNSSNSTYNNCKSRVRKLQFSDGSNIIRSYIPVVWHNSDTTAIATLYDEVYNKMCTPTGSLKAYITTSTTAYTLNDGVQNDNYYLAENGTKTVSSDHTSCYTNAIPVKQGDIVEWTVTAEQVSANKRIHGYTTNADIEVGTTGSWVEMLAKIVFSTTSDTTQTVRFTVPSGINYIRLSHANVRESACKITITTTYEVGSSCSVQTATSNYFNSGLYGNEKWNVRLIAFTPTSTTGQLFGVVRGADYTENLTINSAAATGGGSLSRFDSKVTTQSDVIHMGLNQKSLLQINRYGLFQDSTTVMSWSNPDTFTTQLPCHICKVNGSAGIRPNGCCYLAIDEDGTLVAEYIPVKNKTITTETGLYDRVSGTLNKGVGTHTFNSLS